MAVEIAVNLPHYPKGTIVDIGGVAVENGGSVKLDDDQELALVSRYGKAVKDKIGDNENIKVTGTPKYGPSEVAKLFPPVEVASEENPYVAEQTPQAKEGSDK